MRALEINSPHICYICFKKKNLILNDHECLCPFSEVMRSLQTLSTSLQRHLLPLGFPQVQLPTDSQEMPLMSKPHLQGEPSHLGVQPLVSRTGAIKETDTDHHIMLSDSPIHTSS